MANYWTITATSTFAASASSSMSFVFTLGDKTKRVSFTLPNSAQTTAALADLNSWLNRQRRPLDTKDGVTSL